MNKIKHRQRRHGDPNSDSIHHGFHRPYWKHAHHDWRLTGCGKTRRKTIAAKGKHYYDHESGPWINVVRGQKSFFRNLLIVAVSLMLVAAFIYVMSDDLAWRPRRTQPQQPYSGFVGK